MATISQSPVIQKNRLAIFERAVESYFAKDYLVFIHLVIPQIEEAIRNILEFNGGNVLKFNKGIYNLRLLEDILRDEVINIIFGEDLQTYIRILFTDARGWNVRNEVCHGLRDIELLDKSVADRILHILLIVGMVKR